MFACVEIIFQNEGVLPQQIASELVVVDLTIPEDANSPVLDQVVAPLLPPQAAFPTVSLSLQHDTDNSLSAPAVSSSSDSVMHSDANAGRDNLVEDEQPKLQAEHEMEEDDTMRLDSSQNKRKASVIAQPKTQQRVTLETKAINNFSTWSLSLPNFKLLTSDETDNGQVKIECEVCEVRIHFFLYLCPHPWRAPAFIQKHSEFET